MSVVYYGPNFIERFFEKRRESSERTHTVDGALGLLLDPRSSLRDWHRHPRKRVELHNQLADNPLQCSLVIMSTTDFDSLYKKSSSEGEEAKYEESAIFQSIAVNEKMIFPWVLLEPLHSDATDMKGLKWRLWNQSSAVWFDEVHRPDPKLPVVNPQDTYTPKRQWSPDTLQLCHVIRERFMTSAQQDIIRNVLRKTLADKLKKGAAATIALGVVGCSVAAAICTGTGAMTITLAVANSIIKGAASSVGNRLSDAAIATSAGGAAGALAAAAIAGGSRKQEMPPLLIKPGMDELEARIERLEHAVFEARDPALVKREGDAVVAQLRAVREGK